jgi:hypothetical protein
VIDQFFRSEHFTTSQQVYHSQQASTMPSSGKKYLTHAAKPKSATKKVTKPKASLKPKAAAKKTTKSHTQVKAKAILAKAKKVVRASGSPKPKRKIVKVKAAKVAKPKKPAGERKPAFLNLFWHKVAVQAIHGDSVQANKVGKEHKSYAQKVKLAKQLKEKNPDLEAAFMKDPTILNTPEKQAEWAAIARQNAGI